MLGWQWHGLGKHRKTFLNRHKFLLFYILVSFVVYLPLLGVGSFYNGTDADHALVAKELLESGSYSFFAHPPLIFAFLSGSFLLFGYTTFAARLPFFILYLLGLVFTYLLARRLFGVGVAVLSSFFYLFSGIILNGVVIYWMDLALMSFVLMSIYYHIVFLEGKKQAHLLVCGVFGGLAILSKESGILMFPIFLFSLWRNRSLKRGLGLFVPMFIASFLWVGAYTLLNSGVFYHELSRLAVLVSSLKQPAAYQAGSEIDTVMVFFYLASIPAILRLSHKRVLGVIFAAALLFVIVFGDTHNRYVMPALPYLYILAADLSFAAVRSNMRKWLSLAVLSFLVFLGAYYLRDFRETTGLAAFEHLPERNLRAYLEESTPPGSYFLTFKQSSMRWIDFYLGRQTRHIPLLTVQTRDLSSLQETNWSGKYVIFHKDYAEFEDMRSIFSYFSIRCRRLDVPYPDTSSEYVLFLC